MARRRRSSFKKRSLQRTARRDLFINPIANLWLPRSPLGYEMNDFRTFHPEGPLRPVLRPSGRTVKLYRPTVRLSKKTRVRPPMAHALYAPIPDKVILCVRRKQRKEVLHAKRKTGRVGQRSPRYNSRSEIYC